MVGFGRNLFELRGLILDGFVCLVLVLCVRGTCSNREVLVLDRRVFWGFLPLGVYGCVSMRNP